MTPHAYSRHSLTELESTRDRQRSPVLKEFHRQRYAAQTQSVSVLLDNIRYRLFEVSDLMDDATREPEKVSFRSLLETLRQTEVNLEAAVARLAGELGLIGVES
jgi:hypothetical protein